VGLRVQRDPGQGLLARFLEPKPHQRSATPRCAIREGRHPSDPAVGSKRASYRRPLAS